MKRKIEVEETIGRILWQVRCISLLEPQLSPSVLKRIEVNGLIHVRCQAAQAFEYQLPGTAREEGLQRFRTELEFEEFRPGGDDDEEVHELFVLRFAPSASRRALGHLCDDCRR